MGTPALVRALTGLSLEQYEKLQSPLAQIIKADMSIRLSLQAMSGFYSTAASKTLLPRARVERTDSAEMNLLVVAWAKCVGIDL